MEVVKMENLESLLENLNEESYEFLKKIKNKRRKKLVKKNRPYCKL